jgi:hypothetical protein
MKLVTNLEKILTKDKPITLIVKGGEYHPGVENKIILRSTIHPRALADLQRWVKLKMLYEI